MKKIMSLVLVIFLSIFVSGCATTYWKDRGRDMTDVFSLTAGTSLGVRAKVGLVSAGVYAGVDRVGLRGGEFSTKMGENRKLTCINNRAHMLNITFLTFDIDDFAPQNMPLAIRRHKTGATRNFNTPLFMNMFWSDSAGSENSWRCYLPHYTNIEVAGGAGPGLRVGFNPGELLDFILGFTSLDIFDDDIASRPHVAFDPGEEKNEYGEHTKITQYKRSWGKFGKMGGCRGHSLPSHGCGPACRTEWPMFFPWD